MRTTSTFTTSDFDVTDYTPAIATGLPSGHLRMTKTYAGDMAGRSITQFTSAFDQGRGVGTYVAMESFEGTVDGRRGAFAFAHAASTSGVDRFTSSASSCPRVAPRSSPASPAPCGCASMPTARTAWTSSTSSRGQRLTPTDGAGPRQSASVGVSRSCDG
jgi:hypothetical protein